MNREELAEHIQKSISDALSRFINAPLTFENREKVVRSIREHLASFSLKEGLVEELSRVDAGTLRRVGFVVPEEIPDSSTVATSAIGVVSSEEDKARGIITFRIDPSAEWWPGLSIAGLGRST